MATRGERAFREISDALREGRLDDLLALVTPDAAYVSPPEAVEPGVRSGRAELAEVLSQLREMITFEIVSMDRAEDHGPRSAVDVTMRAVGGASGAPGEQRFGVLLTFEGELVSRYEWFPDPQHPFAELAS